METSSLPDHKQHKAQSLEDILHEFGPITGVSYEPFKCEPRQAARAVLPASFPQNPHPFNYFSLFFTHDLFRTITTNTNRYASIQRLRVPQERAREWTDLLVEELYVFLGAIIYMGVHEEPAIEMYWNTDFNKGPLHTISSHISLHRFEQIKRFCHISCLESDERAGYYLPENKIWWYKLEPLASSIQASSQRYYSPSSEVSIDELMVRCFGRLYPSSLTFFSCLYLANSTRSLHTYKMPKKPIKQGYKIYGIADHGYIFNWIWSSRYKGLQDLVLYPNLTNTGCLVRSLALSLPRRYLIIYLDNYFTSIPLFSELRACHFGAVGTTRPHPGFPKGLTELKARFGTKLEWNTLVARVVQDVLCLAWQDNNIVLGLSNVHTVDKVEDFREKIRKRPAKTSTSRRIVHRAFEGEHTKVLQIPCFIDDYNTYMGGVDLANQFREAYETHKPTLRNWWPLFYWLIDVACINAYRLYQLSTSGRLLTHLQFRIELYCKLLSYSQQAKLESLRVGLGGKRVFNPDLQHLHYWEKRSKGTCTWCSYQLRCQKALGRVVEGRAKRVTWGCVFCKVALCQEGQCWARWHSRDV
jgi:hypothetical protein